MESRRQAKVSKLLMRETAILLQKNSRIWFGNRFVSVSQVKITPDLSYAKVYVTFINEKNPEELLKLLQRRTKDVRMKLATALRNDLRKLPEIQFFYDDTLDYAEHMNRLLDDLNSPKKDSDQDS